MTQVTSASLGLFCLVPLLVVLVVAVVAVVLVWRQDAARRRTVAEPSALDILKARYAAGELTGEEYAQMRRDLEG